MSTTDLSQAVSEASLPRDVWSRLVSSSTSAPIDPRGRPGAVVHRRAVCLFPWHGTFVYDVLAHYDEAGRLDGVHRRAQTACPPLGDEAGATLTVVRPDRRRLGIGLILLRESERRWGIDIAAQACTPEGLALLERVVAERSQ